VHCPWFPPLVGVAQKDIFKTNMTAQVCKAAQPWYPPKTYTHNAKESKNYALKDWMEFRKNSIVVWIIFVKQVDI